MSDDVLSMILIKLTLEKRIGIERTSRRIKVVIDRILSQQKVFTVITLSRKYGIVPRIKKSAMMRSWSPIQSRILCSKGTLFYDTLPWLGKSSSVSILSRCSSVKFVNLECVDVRGKELANWCPFITHFVTDKVAKVSDYVEELIKNKKDVLIESFEYKQLSQQSDADFFFLSKCSKLNTVICPWPHFGFPFSSDIPPDVLSKIKILSIFVGSAEHMDNIIKWSSNNLEQLTICCPFELFVPVHVIADNFDNLVHLETHIEIQDFDQLIKLRNIQSIKSLWSSLNQENIATFEQFLLSNGSKLKYLGIQECTDNLTNRAVALLAANCPNLIYFKIWNGIKLNKIELETIKLLPKLEKITLDIRSLSESPPGVEKVRELLLRCKNSMRKVSLSNRCVQRTFFFLGTQRTLFSWPEDIESRDRMEELDETIGILCDHKRTYENSAHNGKPLSSIKLDGKTWNGSSTVNQFFHKISFHY